MRFQRLIPAVILACAVSACAKDVTGVTRTLPPLAYVRYVNAVPDTFNMDFRAVDQVAYSQPFLNTAFKGLGDGNYQGYQAGSRHIRIFLDPNPSSTTVNVDQTVVSTIVVDQTLSLTAGHYYTLVHIGHTRAPANDSLWVIDDATMPATPAGLAYRVINAAPVQGNVDVFVRADSTTALVAGAATAPNLAAGAAFPAAGGFATIATGPFVIRLTTPGTVVRVGGAATLSAGTAGTTAADPIFGSGQAGSIFTAFIFDARSPGSVSPTVAAAPGVVYFPDVQPPRTTTP